MFLFADLGWIRFSITAPAWEQPKGVPKPLLPSTECSMEIATESCTLGPRRNTMPDPNPTKDQDPTQPEASKEDAPDGTELTDEQLEKAAGGIGHDASNGMSFT